MIHVRSFISSLLLSGALLLSLPCHAAGASGDGGESSWRLFKSEPGRFSVEMLGTPQQTETQTKSFVGTITHHIFLLKDSTGEYTVSYSDLPGFAVKFTGSNTIYSHAKGALLMETLGKEQRYQDTTLNGMHGKHLVYDLPDPQGSVDMRGEAYLFIIGTRLYVIDANVPQGRSQAGIRHFFSTFHTQQK